MDTATKSDRRRLLNAVAAGAAGAALAAGAMWAFGNAAAPANAQGPSTGGVTLSAAQLLINQRISQAAVRRSNRTLNYLAPVRSGATDGADDGTNGVRPLAQVPGAGEGWTSSQIGNGAITEPKIGDGAVTTSKVGDGSVTNAKLSADVTGRFPLWAYVNGDGTLNRGTEGVTSTRINAGNYRVDVGRDMNACAFTGTQYVTNPALIGFIGIQVDVANDDQLFVRTTDQAGTTEDRAFMVQVTC